MAAGMIGTGGGMGTATEIGIVTAIATVIVIETGIGAGRVMSMFPPGSTLTLELIPMADTMAGRTVATAAMATMATMATMVVETSATGSRRATGMGWIEGVKTRVAAAIQLPTTLSTSGT